MNNWIGLFRIRPGQGRTLAFGWLLCFATMSRTAEQASGQGPPEQDIERQVKTLWKEGRVAEAEDLASRALGEAQRRDGEASLAAARWHLWLGRLGPAGDHLEKAIAITRKEDPKGVLAAESLDEKGNLLCLQQRYKEALPLFQKGLEIREKLYDEYSLELIPSLESIARCSRLMRDFAAAVPPLTRALEIRERRLGPGHRSTAISLRTLGDLRRAQLEFAAARPLLEKALEIRQRVLGPDDPLTGESLHDLAALFHDQGRIDEAETLYRQSLVIRLESLGANSPDTLSTVSSLARLYREMDREEAAKRLEADPSAFVAL